MKVVIEQRVCDECGLKQSRNIKPVQFGNNPFEGWIEVNNVLDLCSAKCAERHFRL